MSLAMKMSRARYQGDPGLGGFLKGAFNVGSALVTGGPTAAAGTLVQQLRGRGGSPTSPVYQQPGGAPAWFRKLAPVPGATTQGGAPPPGRVDVTPVPGLAGVGQRLFPGGATGFEVVAPAMNGCKVGGYHLNKSSYFLITGEFVPAGSRWVKNRRRNPGNIKAASRALSRVTATKNALKTFSRVSIRDKNAVKTKTVVKCGKCGYTKCRC